MEFERARSEEQLNKRRKDIKTACIFIYDKEGFDAVNLKRISEMTTVKRSTIYNYYSTKEEILIDILADEIIDWTGELAAMQQTYSGKTTVSPEDFSKELTATILKRDRMVRLYSVLFSLLEPCCSLEKLIAFKEPAIRSSAQFVSLLLTVFPHFSQEQAVEKANQILCFILGLFPMSHLNDKQKEALKALGNSYCAPDYEKTCISGITGICR